jgi:hypothetical protein
MVGRILHFSQPYHLSVRLSQLVITNKETGEIINRPIEDTAVLMLEHPAADLHACRDAGADGATTWLWCSVVRTTTRPGCCFP